MIVKNINNSNKKIQGICKNLLLSSQEEENGDKEDGEVVPPNYI